MTKCLTEPPIKMMTMQLEQLTKYSFIYWRRKWQPTPLFLPGESHGQRSLIGFINIYDQNDCSSITLDMGRSSKRESIPSTTDEGTVVL